MTTALGDQPALWQDRVLLDEDFYRALSEHPVPVRPPEFSHREPGTLSLAHKPSTAPDHSPSQFCCMLRNL
jgi:hypothetical protein